MSVKLTKGQRVDLKKEAPNLKRVLIGLGWDPAKMSPAIDIDASIVCLDGSNHANTVVYYGNKSAYNAIKHYGDNLTGDGDGDDEQIEVCLDKVPAGIQKLSVIINIYSAYSRRQHFGKVKNCFVHVDDLDTHKELVRYDIDGKFDNMTGIFVAELYRYNGEWKFKANGDGVKVADIREMCRKLERI